ncbi:MAG: ribonuclease E activity regulator RraA [Gammaproteobacteria bacterium]
MVHNTADLCDTHDDLVRIADPLFADFGGRLAFHGRIATVKCHEDNSMVRAAIETAGEGRVLIVDGGGSIRCALIGDQLAALALDNGWAGAIVYGCIRDSAAVCEMDFGLKALETHPRRSTKKGVGERDVTVDFAGVTFVPDEHVYADPDGIIVSAKPLHE